jgi:hypothetical protein
MAKGFYCEKNTEIIESKKWGIEACEKKRQDRYSDYANAIHRLRMHAYDRIIDHHKELKNGEIIASEILPLIFNELQLETNGWDFEYALNNLHGWSRLMNADYEEPGQLDVMNEEGEAAKPIKVVLLATSRHYDSVKNKTSACLGPSFSKNAKYSLDCLSNFLNITQELAAKRTDLEELEKNPSEDLYINWEGALFSKRENVEVDAHTLDWISNGTGGDALERLSTEIDTAARNGSKSLILTAEWFDHEDCFPTQNEMSYIFKELGFKVSPANNGIEVSWS